MAISDIANEVTMVGNGVATSQAIAFPLSDLSDVVVNKIDVLTGAVTLQTVGTDYSLSGTADGNGIYQTSTFTPVILPPTNTNYLITRSTPFTQTVNYLNFPNILASVHQKAMERLTLMMQDVKTIVGKYITLHSSYTGTVELQPRSTGAGDQVLVQDANGLITPKIAANVGVTPMPDPVPVSGQLMQSDGTSWLAQTLATILSLTGNGDKYLRANSSGTGLVLETLATMLGLAGNGDKTLTVNSAGTGLSFITPTASIVRTQGALKSITANSNIEVFNTVLEAPSGHTLFDYDLYLECVTAEHGYVTGERVAIGKGSQVATATYGSGSYVKNPETIVSRIYATSAATIAIIPAAGGTAINITFSKWNYRCIALTG